MWNIDTGGPLRDIIYVLRLVWKIRENEVAGEHDVADTGEFRDVYRIFVGSLKERSLLEDR
jgi:hypothetical protein